MSVGGIANEPHPLRYAPSRRRGESDVASVPLVPCVAIARAYGLPLSGQSVSAPLAYCISSPYCLEHPVS